MKKLKMFAFAALLVAGVGAASVHTSGPSEQIMPGPACGGCWPD